MMVLYDDLRGPIGKNKDGIIGLMTRLKPVPLLSASTADVQRSQATLEDVCIQHLL